MGRLALSGFKTYYKATAIKTMWCQYKDRNITQWDRIESAETDPYISSKFISDKETKTTQSEIAFSTSDTATIRYSCAKE